MNHHNGEIPEKQEELQSQESKKPPKRNNKNDGENKDISPRLIMIERNQNGEIQNEEELGSLNNYKNELKNFNFHFFFVSFPDYRQR